MQVPSSVGNSEINTENEWLRARPERPVYDHSALHFLPSVTSKKIPLTEGIQPAFHAAFHAAQITGDREVFWKPSPKLGWLSLENVEENFRGYDLVAFFCFLFSVHQVVPLTMYSIDKFTLYFSITFVLACPY